MLKNKLNYYSQFFVVNPKLEQEFIINMFVYSIFVGVLGSLLGLGGGVIMTPFLLNVFL